MSACFLFMAASGAFASPAAGASVEDGTSSVVSTHAPERAFPLVRDGRAADIYVASGDWEIARIAARDLAGDIERVSGCRSAVKHVVSELSAQAVLVGTLGRCPAIDGLIEDGRLRVDDIEGQWETSLLVQVERPLPGVKHGLVIVGSDRRGTAYGVYELSRRIGVSPWYWWADVTPAHRDTLHVSPGRLRVGPPAVKYRGIFINDEMWGIRPWAAETFAPEEGLGLGPKTYAKIFELLLRLRANYIWPAMHVQTIPFNCYAENRVVADRYGIVMGSSHIEPMLRNNIRGAEWDREEGSAWNYLTNRDAVYRYWERRVQANGRYENVYTIGMRGKDDEAMEGGRTVPEKIALLERIFHDQRKILGKHVDPDPVKTPQVFIPYTEVLGLYDAGLKVPDDVTICWPDDNFGYIRRLPTATEQKRRGGSGIYYHIQWLNGATTAYTWLNSTPPALIWQEMFKAWTYGAKDLWVLNVGDIKPGEIGMEFFLDMAWNPEPWRHDNVRVFLEKWAARDLDAGLASDIAAVMEEYFRLGFARRPEHLVQFRHASGLRYSWFSHDHYNDEAQRRLDRYAAIGRRAEAIYERLPTQRKDAFFQLVLYPVQCAYLMNEKAICADKNVRHAVQGRADAARLARRARAAADRIVDLTARYNTGLVTAGAKWNRMMSPAPGPWGNQRLQFEMPPLNDFAGDGPAALHIVAEGGESAVSVDLSVYTRGRRFIDLVNKGLGEITWKATASKSWVHLSETEGTFSTGHRLWVSVDWNQAPKESAVEALIVVESNCGAGQIVVQAFNPAQPARDTVTGFVESHGCVSMEAEHFTRKQDREGAAWTVVGGLGRSGDSATVWPPTLPSRTEPADIAASSPTLTYDMYLFNAGDFELHVDALPTKPVAPGRGTRIAVSIDGGAPEVLDGKGGDVLANLRRYVTSVRIEVPGRHSLTLGYVDPGVIVDKIVLYTAAPKESYLGPPESYRR